MAPSHLTPEQMHSHSHKQSILITSAVVALALTSPVLASPASPFESSTLAAVQPGQSRSKPDLPANTLTVPTPTPRLLASAIQPTAFPSANPDFTEDDELEDAVHAIEEGAEMHEKRWNNLCDGCEPSTGTKSFSGASKSLTPCRKSYPHAKKTVVTKKKKKVFTTQGCKTTTTRKVKQTMVSESIKR